MHVASRTSFSGLQDEASFSSLAHLAARAVASLQSCLTSSHPGSATALLAVLPTASAIAMSITAAIRGELPLREVVPLIPIPPFAPCDNGLAAIFDRRKSLRTKISADAGAKINQCITLDSPSLAQVEAGECLRLLREGAVHAGIELLYIEGEIKAGRLTGRTVLVIETSREIDPGRPGYSSADVQRLIAAACAEWERHYEPADTVRLEYCPQRQADVIRSEARH